MQLNVWNDLAKAKRRWKKMFVARVGLGCITTSYGQQTHLGFVRRANKTCMRFIRFWLNFNGASRFALPAEAGDLAMVLAASQQAAVHVRVRDH